MVFTDTERPATWNEQPHTAMRHSGQFYNCNSRAHCLLRQWARSCLIVVPVERKTMFNIICRYGVLNASDYGVPQNRRRAVIIGKLGGDAPCLPKPKSNTVTIWDAISDFAFLESGEGQDEQAYKMPPESEYEKLLRKNSEVLYNHVATKHSALALERLALIPPNAEREVLPKEHLTKSI